MTGKDLLVVLISATLVLAVVTFAQKAAVPKQPNRSTLAQENVKELLFLMDADKNGKISKQEWMKFMEAEFDRLDNDKKGELDQKELLHSTVTVKHARSSDLG